MDSNTLLIVAAVLVFCVALTVGIAMVRRMREERRREKVAKNTEEEWYKAVNRHRTTTSNEAPSWRDPPPGKG